MSFLPIRLYALGSSELSLVFVTTTHFLNCAVHFKEIPKLIVVTILIHLCYFFSASFHVEHLLVITFFQLCFFIPITLLHQKSETIKELYNAQCLYMTSIYHEINTPLNGISCAADNLEHQMEEGETNPDDTSDWLQIIKDNAFTLSQMIHNMLTFSQYQGPGPASMPKLQPVSLEEFIQPLWKLFLTYPKAKDVELSLDNQIEGYGVMADQTILQQILINLVTNALKV